MSLPGLLWRIRYRYEDWYFKHYYTDKEAKIYYDKNFKEYINPLLRDERSSNLIYVCSELVRDSLYYGYMIDDKHQHAHAIDEVFEEAYNHAETFKLEDETAFSLQELRIIYKLINQGIKDRKGDKRLKDEQQQEISYDKNKPKVANEDEVRMMLDKINKRYKKTFRSLAAIEKKETKANDNK